MQSEIADANRTFMETFARGDAAGLAALYSSAPRLLPPGSEMVSDRRGIQSVWQGAMDGGVKRAELSTLELEQHGDTRNEIGRYRLYGADGQLVDQGKYLVVWTREGGDWKLHWDIWNSSQPAT